MMHGQPNIKIYMHTYITYLFIRKIYICIHYSYIHKYLFIFFFAVALRPNAGHDLLILEVSRSHTTTHHSR